jgi:hypothetical protein
MNCAHASKKLGGMHELCRKRLISKGFGGIYLDQNGATHYRISPFASSKEMSPRAAHNAAPRKDVLYF